MDGLLPSSVTLEANLRVMAVRSPRAAEAVARAGARHDVTFSRARDGAVTGVVGLGNGQRRLASEFEPLREGKRLADSVDVIASAVVAVRGFGVGHHVAALAHRLGAHGAVVVFEPDVELLRAVLERVDCSAWMASCPVVFVTGADDQGELTGVLSGLEGVVALGTKIIDHPASRARLRESAENFGRTLAGVVSAVRTNVATTLVQSEVTLRNLLNNAGVYTGSAGIADLAGSRAGLPAVLVSAGPSLRKNVELLKQPGVRERVVIIAVQTVLKQLLAMGVRPHFVTALDYHEISARFYEGLTAHDVEGVTLVIEPKCNPAIPRSFPGTAPGSVRCVGDATLDRVLGAGLTWEMGTLPPGATVAHLSYAFARHLGCDPVILIGQDLGFTDHQYYGCGAAIHRVWSGELSDFRTLEMMEWERVARMRGLLRRVSDQQGRAMYTDEQMSTYQALFEKAFQQDVARGLTIIDATEGGTLKQHTRVMPLGLALERYAPGDIAPGIASEDSVHVRGTPEASRVQERLRNVSSSAVQVRDACRATVLDLSEMRDHLEDQGRVNALIERVTQRGQAIRRESAYWIAQHLNQAGALNRFKADRAIALSPSLTPMETQRKQIERDIRNVQFLGEAAQQAWVMLEESCAVLGGASPRTSDPAAKQVETGDEGVVVTNSAGSRRVVALICVDERRSALGARRARGELVETLSRTLERLGRCKELDAVALAAETEHAARALMDDVVREVPRGTRGGATLPRLEPHAIDIHALRASRRSVRAARLWSRHCWRGAIGGLSVFDEVASPGAAAALAQATRADAVVLVGDDWVLVDPELIDAAVARHREAPDRHRFTFSQAPAGLCGCVIDAGLLRELAGVRGAALGGVRGTFGGLLAYLPDSPRMDPIAKSPCVPVPHGVRDCLTRFAWDDVNFRHAWEDVPAARGAEAWTMNSAECVRAVRGVWGVGRVLLPEVVEVNTGAEGVWEGVGGIAGVVTRVRDIAVRQPLLGVTIQDEEASGEWRAVADGARAAGAAGLHLRLAHAALTRWGVEPLIEAMDFGIDVVSVDLPGDSREVWRARCGEDTRDQAWGALQEFLDEREKRSGGGLPCTWLVPRITRCDATLDEVEGFYDRWISACGACVIDPPRMVEGVRRWESVPALPAPADVAERRAWSHLRIEGETAAWERATHAAGAAI